MADSNQSNNNEVSEKPDMIDRRNVLESRVWIGILITYLALFCATGYIAFIGDQYNPALSWSQAVTKALSDENKKAFVIDALKQEGESFKKQRELASQSFNVVLGAILGFLSASAASAFRRRQPPDQPSR